MTNLVEVTITADDLTGPAFASVLAKVAALRSALREAAGFQLNLGNLDGQLAQLRSKLQSHKIADLLDINMNPGQIETQLQFLKRKISDAKISDLLDVNLNTADVTKSLSRLEGEISGASVPFRITPEIIGNLNLGALPKLGETLNVNVGGDAAASLSAADAAATKLTADLGALAAAAGGASGGSGGGGLTGLGAAAGAAAGGNGGNGGGIRGAATAAAAAGGAFLGWRGVMAGTIGPISLVHLAIDGVIEGLVAVGTATAAAAVGLAAMAPAAQDIYTHLQAIQAVNSALGSSIPPLTGQFQSLAQSLAPQVVEAYGGALNLVSRQTGVLGGVASQVVTLFDDWIAKLDIWAAKQNNFGGLLQSGVGFLQQFGHILGQLGMALDNLVVKDPGTAHFLLDILGGAASLLNMISKLPAPILETALAIHSFYIWGGAAAGVLAKLPGPLGALGKALSGLSNPQLLILAALATAAFELARAWDSASPAVAKDIQNVQQWLGTLSASQAFTGGLAQSLHNFNQELTSQSIVSVLPTWHGFSNVFQEVDDRAQAFGHNVAQVFSASTWSGFARAVGGVFESLDPAFSRSQGAAIQVQHNMADIEKAINSSLGSYVTMGDEIGNVTKQGYTFSQAMEIMDLAGVKWNDTAGEMRQKVTNLVTGYQNMSVSGGILAGAVDSITFASELQSSKVGQLTSAYSTWYSTISGGLSTLNTFEQDMLGLDKATGMSTDNMGGLTAAQVQAQGQFLSTEKAAQDQFNSLVTLAGAAQLGSKGTGMLTQAMKDYIALLLPAAQGNTGLQSTLVSMAQEVNPNVTSFQQLTTWVGNVKGPMSSLDGITTTFTTDAGYLKRDIQGLSTTLGTDLTNAMQSATFAATGGSSTFTALAGSVLHTQFNSDSMKTAAYNLAYQLVQTTGSASQAKTIFEDFATHSLGLTKQQADTLWQETFPSVQKSIDSLHGKDVPIGVTGLKLTEQQLTAFQNQIASLHGTTFGVNVDANGYVDVNGYKISAGGYFSPHAAGGIIAGGMPFSGNQGDDVLISAKRGEAIVPVGKVAQVAPALSAAGIPGFAGGGVVGTHGNLGMAFPWGATHNIESDAIWATQQVAVNATKAFAKYVAQQKAAQDATTNLLKGVLGNGPHSGSAAVAQSFAKSILWAYGWGMSQWPYELALWNRESGWDSYAVNPSSGAYGIPQALGHGHPYNLGDYQAQIRWGDAYISGRYGNPANAWAHEVAYGWYDHGGWLKPGWTMAYNGTGSPEPVGPAAGGTVCLEVTSGGASAFEQFMLKALREWVRVKGGGDVQKAFGRP